MNIPILVGVGMLFLIIIVFQILRNNKDRKELEEQLNNDYKKPVDQEDEVDTAKAKD